MGCGSRNCILFLLSAASISMTIQVLNYLNDDTTPRLADPRPIAPDDIDKEIARIIQNQESIKFWINTPTCSIPFTPIGNKSKSKKKLKCGTSRPLTEAHGLNIVLYPERLVDYKEAKDQHTLSGEKIQKNLHCEYQGIIRVQQDPNKYTRKADGIQRLKPAVHLVENVTAIEEDGVQVSCSVNQQSANKTKKKVIYKNVHTFFQPSRVDLKLNQFKNSGGWSGSPDLLNVVMVGTDSTSRINLMRHMPQTYKYLTKELGAIDFPGYNKVADNTDPNLSAALMGWSWKYFSKQKVCHKGRYAKFDDCPLIWKNFSSKGYVTAYAEDAPWMGLFHYSNRMGYVIQPTDYYNRPYFLMSEKFIGHDGGFANNRGHRCQGTKLSVEIINDWNIQLLREMKEVPVFSFTWTSSTTHGNYEDARWLDEIYLKYISSLKNEGHLNNTVLVFMSDHGTRTGEHRKTYPGMMEERLPYLLLVFPPSFKDKYPRSWVNMKLNTNRLVTHFDLHNTLLAVLNEDNTKPSPSAYAIGYGQSLFYPIPLNRTCESVGIIDHYCTCDQSEELDPSSKEVHRAVVSSVNHLNKLLKYNSKCSQLEIHKVNSARLRKPHNSTTPKKGKAGSISYIVTFETHPGNAAFESTVHIADENFSVSDVSRINMYGNQSYCIDDNNLKKYCYCNNF